MNKINFLIAISMLLVFSSCYEEEDWLGDNLADGGTYFPVIQSVLTELPDDATFSEGTTVNVSVWYWSRDAVKEVKITETIDGVEKQLTSSGSSTRFDVEKNVDVLEYDYAIPAGSSGKEITITATVITVNDLDRVKSSSFTVE